VSRYLRFRVRRQILKQANKSPLNHGYSDKSPIALRRPLATHAPRASADALMADADILPADAAFLFPTIANIIFVDEVSIEEYCCRVESSALIFQRFFSALPKHYYN